MNQANVFSILLNNISSTGLAIALLGILATIFVMVVFVTNLGNLILPKPKETLVSDFLPFSRLDSDGATIHMRNGSLARVFELTGTDTTLASDEDRNILVEKRKQWIDALSELEITSRIITMREKIPLSQETYHAQNPLLQKMSSLWMDSLHRIFKNKHYLILYVNDRKDAMNDLIQASNATTAILDSYKPVLISEKTPNRHEDKSPFWLFAKLISPVSKPKPIVGFETGEELNSFLTSDYIHFTKDEGIIRFLSGDKEKLAICIGIKKPGDFMDEQMTAKLLAIDCEITITHNIRSFPKVKANAIIMQQRRMAYITSFSESVRSQYTLALEWMDPSDVNSQSLNEYAMSIFLFGDSKEELTFGQQEVEKICRLYGVTPVREGWVAQAVFFSQFPSYEIYPRTYLYLSRVIACSVCMDKTNEGRTKSDWGPVPLSYFRTITGTPYAFQFHVTEENYAVAHTALIGPTGQGKTTFFSFMAGQSARIPDLRTYFFDRNNGAKVFALLQGAPYIRFDGGENTVALNPFSMQNTPENKAFLRTWLRSITGCTDAYSEEEIARAVTTAYDYLHPDERILKNLYKSSFSLTGNMRRELKRWVSEDQYGRIFNAKEDQLDLNSPYTAFDFTHIFQDGILAPAVISYIMYRIHNLASLQGTPSLIMIDETAPMLEHPMFRETFIVGLREGRKKRQAFLCAFQQPKFLDENGLGDVIRGQCQTVIFFRNLQANPSDYATWNLSPRELNFILGKEFMDHKYAILVSRPAVNESVILDINLSGLGPYLKVYSSGSKNVILAEQLSRNLNFSKDIIQQYLQFAD